MLFALACSVLFAVLYKDEKVILLIPATSLVFFTGMLVWKAMWHPTDLHDHTGGKRE